MNFWTGQGGRDRARHDGRPLDRRDLLKTVLGGAAVAAVVGIARAAFAEEAAPAPAPAPKPLKGRIRQGV